jgi:hypothetical protein
MLCKKPARLRECSVIGVSFASALSRKLSGFKLWSSSPPADRSDNQRLFPGQLDFFGFMADHEPFPLTQLIGHRLRTELDLQPLPAVR